MLRTPPRPDTTKAIRSRHELCRLSPHVAHRRMAGCRFDALPVPDPPGLCLDVSLLFQHGGRAENAVITEAASRPARAIDNRPRTPPYRHVAPAGADYFFSVITVFSDVLRAEKARPSVPFSIAGVWPRVA